jgi:hypothetical protein
MRRFVIAGMLLVGGALLGAAGCVTRLEAPGTLQMPAMVRLWCNSGDTREDATGRLLMRTTPFSRLYASADACESARHQSWYLADIGSYTKFSENLCVCQPERVQ